MNREDKNVTSARSNNGLGFAANRSVFHPRSRMSSYDQQIRLLQGQFLLDERQRIAVLDGQQWPAFTQLYRVDQPGQRVLALLPDGARELGSFSSAERQGPGRNVVLERFLVCVKEVDAGLGKEGCRELYLRCRSVRKINWDEDPSVRGLIRIADHQDWLLQLLQQTLDGAGDEPIRERTSSVPTGHHEIDVVSLSARRYGNSGISNADIDAIRQLGARCPSANLSLKAAPSMRPPRFDEGSRKFAVDNVKDGQVAFPLDREPGSSYERDFRLAREVMGQEHLILLSGEPSPRNFQTNYIPFMRAGDARAA
jgi:hypothetical protein